LLENSWFPVSSVLMIFIGRISANSWGGRGQMFCAVDIWPTWDLTCFTNLGVEMSVALKCPPKNVQWALWSGCGCHQWHLKQTKVELPAMWRPLFAYTPETGRAGDPS
jgi:hypothetical protein